MTTEKPAGMGQVYLRADAASRQVVVQLGLGVVSFVLGSMLSVGASARIGERLGPIESDLAVTVLRVFFEHLWVIAVLPVFGYAIGRFTEIPPTRFALVSAISGETFAVLLLSAINGFDYLLSDTPGLIGRGVSLFVGMVITAWAVNAGREVSAEAQVEADKIAAQKKEEYAAFLASAEGKKEEAVVPDPQTVRPHPDPLPKGEGDAPAPKDPPKT